MDRDEQRIGKILRHLLDQERERAGRVSCANEEDLASYLEGILGEEAQREVEGHVAKCSFCIEDLVAFRKAAQDSEMGIVPKRIIDRAMAVVPSFREEQNFLDLVVRIAKGALELLSTSGQAILPPAPLPIRGAPRPPETSSVQVEKEMGKLKVSVEVEREEEGLCQVSVRVSGQEGKPAEGIRLTLTSRRREQASYLTRQGEAIFDRIPPGDYNLAVLDSGTLLGTIRLRIVDRFEASW